ncbi:hypothetical protein ATK74_3043 [Propionicimonas paludicola]|uniref:SIR2-like protein n=1 Tax=Propionicimonas paludicola TaxID=185243 RepID=A0A2A9CVM2_9ACTN|nr:hypothetical protein [Propionicimonas paludicola]PFG15495.1 hypothetical protein ATK74_0013 [Propionicimonas paludicola]PFG18453.1 hypothetical protein ATK74_3043 [Propionicimonas paludicola]
MNEHFFRRQSTYARIRDLSTPDHWVVYVGLGATIDRTDVSWSNLVQQLLGKFWKETDANLEDVSDWVTNLGPERAATAAEALYQWRDKGNWVGHLQADLGSILYGPRRMMAGMLLQALSMWAAMIAWQGGSVLFVTPNYDSYLYEELHLQSEGLAPRVVLNPVVVLGEGEGLPGNVTSPGSLTCVHLHGSVPYGDRPVGIPVVGEVTYSMTSARTSAFLTECIESARLLIVGSSVSDGPLVSSLIATSSSEGLQPRYAILPHQGSEWLASSGVRHGIKALSSDRLAALALTAINPDFYSQVAQLLLESTWALMRGDVDRLETVRYRRRYDERLARWWRGWSGHCDDSAAQAFHHDILDRYLKMVRFQLGASPDEGLKIEIWARWSPNHLRELALWAASIGTWRDHELMRRDTISLESPYFAVRVFCAGSPQLDAAGADAPGRWKTSFGMPLWHDGKGDGPVPVGVVVVSSTWGVKAGPGHGESSLRERNLDRIQRAMPWLEEAGELILDKEIPAKSRGEVLREIDRALGA